MNTGSKTKVAIALEYEPESGGAPRVHHPHDATRRTGEQRVLPSKVVGVHQTTVGLHEHEPRTLPFRPQTFVHLAHVPSEDRRQIGVDDSRVAA